MRLKFNYSQYAMSNILISSVFFIMATLYLFTLSQYWQNVLAPRLSIAAQTQAEILSNAQANILLTALEVSDSKKREEAIEAVFSEILLITDPSINEPFIKGVSLELDEQLINTLINGDDLQEGIMDCHLCLKTQVPLVDREFNVVAIAHFTVTDAYYRWLSSDLKDELISQALITLVLFTVVWIIILVLVSRLNKVKRNIERSDRAKTRFIANVSHELRTPLNVIMGYTQLFKNDSSLMENQGKGVDTIHHSAEHLLTLINDILDFSKAENEHVVLTIREMSLKRFLNTLVEMSSVRAEMKGISFNYHFKGNLPDVVLVDEQRLRQVLLNLIYNAVKFTEKGSVTFSVALNKTNQAKVVGGNQRKKSTLHFSIKDTGIGIPKSMLEKIFIAYQQVDNNLANAEGSGLGLAISKSLVELMGAKLRVNSKYGQGSEFSFELTLPIVTESNVVGDQIINDINENNSPAVMLGDLSQSTDLAIIKTPEHKVILELKNYAINHNILAIRSLLSTLEENADYLPFIEQLSPFVQRYQFSKLDELLSELLAK